MGGIAVELDNGQVRLSFENRDKTTVIVMDPDATQALFAALGQVLAEIGSGEIGQESDADEADLLDIASPTIEIGTDESGQAALTLQTGLLPPFRLRLTDDEARQVAQGLTEILAAPRDVRTSHGDH